MRWSFQEPLQPGEGQEAQNAADKALHELNESANAAWEIAALGTERIVRVFCKYCVCVKGVVLKGPGVLGSLKPS